MSIPIPDTAELQSVLGLSEEPTFVNEGGFKAVFRAKVTSGPDEAIKAVYLPKATNDQEALHRGQLVARAKREIEALAECQRQGIVKLGSLAPIEATVGAHDYLIYSEEFLEGHPLDEWIISQKVPTFEELRELMMTLVDLIDELNSLGYLHRDIKPSNVVETNDSSRRFVLLDLGIAYKEQGTQLTMGAAPGTLIYMAPEMLNPDYKDVMDFRADIYSAALTVFVLATKTHPFAPKPELRQITQYRITQLAAAPLHSLRPDLPEDFCKIIDRCMRKKPALRFGSTQALQTALQQAGQ